jgi:hypothetical protein
MIGLTVIRSRIGSTLVPNIAKATVPLGLSKTSLPLLIEALIIKNTTMIMEIPGINLQIIEAATVAVKNTYAEAFR